MLDGRMQAYADDFDIISVYLSKNFYLGDSRDFYIRDMHGIKQDLVIEKIENRDTVNKYRLKLKNGKLEVGKVYDVVEHHGLAVELQFRYIVQKEEFLTMFYNTREDFGASCAGSSTLFVLWAPTASSVSVIINPFGERRTFAMKRVERGAWQIRIPENLHGQDYLYLLNVNGSVVESTDPYAFSSIANGKASSVIDYAQIDIDFYDEYAPSFSSYTDAIIFEANVRDFSSYKNTSIVHKSQFLGMIEKRQTTTSGNPAGFDYFEGLGATHIQLMPVNDFNSVDELFPSKLYNWGYDPFNYNALEGSYSTSPNDPLSRVVEFSTLVSSFHKHGMGVIIDVVYNHMSDIASSPFEITVPYSFFRRSSTGKISNGSYCGNDVDSQKPMVRKFIIDSVLHYLRHYHVDGFRFDLMGILDIDTMNELAARLRAEKPNIMIYGEGWDMPTFLKDEEKCTIKNAHLTKGLGFFNDYYRDNVKGPTSLDRKFVRGYALGDASYLPAFKASLLANTQESYGSKLFSSPEMSINYVEAHDNMTLWDKIEDSCRGESFEMMKQRQKFINGALALSQGVPFYHMGQEFCRTKNGIDNSYMSSDEINKIDYDRAEKFSDVVNYTKAMLSLRKWLPIFSFKTAEEIARHVVFEDLDQGLLLMKFIHIEELTPYSELRVYFNPFTLTQEIELSEAFELLADENGLKEGMCTKISLRPLSITVLAKDA